jgi:hypothetical protein
VVLSGPLTATPIRHVFRTALLAVVLMLRPVAECIPVTPQVNATVVHLMPSDALELQWYVSASLYRILYSPFPPSLALKYHSTTKFSDVYLAPMQWPLPYIFATDGAYFSFACAAQYRVY